MTLSVLYEPCAERLLSGIGVDPDPAAPTRIRCAALRAQGLLSADAPQAQAEEAAAIIAGYGFEAEQRALLPIYNDLHEALAIAFANMLGRFGVTDHLCGFSYGGVSGDTPATPIALDAASDATLYAASTGIPPTAGIAIINNNAVGGAVEYHQAVSAQSGLADRSLDGFRCLRDVVQAQRVQSGTAITRASVNLRGKPAIIVSGRGDGLLPPNHTARPYYASDLLLEGANSRLRYYEIEHAQHLDAIIPAHPQFIPLHYYYGQALELMYAYLRAGAALPPSQVVRTVPRALVGSPPAPEPLAVEKHLRPIAAQPAEVDAITFTDGVLRVAD